MPPPLPAILFQNQRYVVLDKPAGLPVHPGPRGGPSVEDWFPALSRRKDGPWLAHRLDADTAGCLVIALRRAALIAAQAEFAAGRARKVYWAIVRGTTDGNAGTIVASLRRSNTRTGWHMVVDPAGQSAITDWQVLGRAGDLTWLAFRPRTGRTHQVRVHAACLGCPILDDPVYGNGAGRGENAGRMESAGRVESAGRGDHAGRLHLLARAIELTLDPPLLARAEPPEHMRDALLRCGWAESACDNRAFTRPAAC